MKKLIAVLGIALPVLLGAAGPARAEVLSVFGEDIDVACTGTCTSSTTAGRFRSAWSRRGTNVVGSTSDPPSNRFAIGTFSGQSTIWLHAQNFWTAGSGATTNNAQAIRIIGADGNPAVIIRATGTNGQVKITKRSTAGTLTDLVTCSSGTFPTDNTLIQIDVNLVYAVSGSIDLYLNGSASAFCTYSGDVTTDGRTQVGGIELSAFGLVNSAVWSEVIVSTTDTRTMGLLTIPPIANGNAMQWGGTNPCSDILDVTSANDASFISSTANDELAQCTISPSIPAGTWGVEALAMSARVKRSGTGPQNVKFVTRTGGTDYFSSDFAPGASFTNLFGYIQSVNPATSNPFTTTELGTAGFNIGISSEP